MCVTSHNACKTLISKQLNCQGGNWHDSFSVQSQKHRKHRKRVKHLWWEKKNIAEKCKSEINLCIASTANMEVWFESNYLISCLTYVCLQTLKRNRGGKGYHSTEEISICPVVTCDFEQFQTKEANLKIPYTYFLPITLKISITVDRE